jgi:hypothetical protein
VRARHRLVIEGNVDRAVLESGGDMEVHGSIMSSKLRAGGDNAALAGIFDSIEHVPSMLAEVATRARELRDAAGSRGQDMGYGLSVQLVIERIYKGLLAPLAEASAHLHAAGPQHEDLAEQFHEWHRQLSTAANIRLSASQFSDIIGRMGALVDSIRDLVHSRANLVVQYVQASEAEATGVITVRGKGIFNSRLTAWSGLVAEHHKAVVRGGSVMSHGPIHVAEVGSPGGSTMHVQLGRGGSLDAMLVYGGTVVTTPGGNHRFLADRSNVKVELVNNTLDVSSLAA